jgi:transposase
VRPLDDAASLAFKALVARRRIAVLVGVTPISRDSGQMGRRTVWGGRPGVRTILYMATVAGVGCNPLGTAAYRRLRRQGKPAKVALMACMRKLLVILNAMLREQASWRPA